MTHGSRVVTHSRTISGRNYLARACLGILTLLAQSCSKEDKQIYILVSEDFLRHHAIASTNPAFPANCLLGTKLGVAVVEVFLDENALLRNAHILDAPCPGAIDTISKSLSEWHFAYDSARFAYDSRGSKAIVKGKLTFYFRVDADGRGRVTTPDETEHWELIYGEP